MPTDESHSKHRPRRRRFWPVRAPDVGQWRSAAGFEAYRAAYEEVLASVPAPTRTHDVLTDYGSARVYEWEGPGERAPVALLPGMRSGAPMWVENIEGWIGERTLYALDAIGDAGCRPNRRR